MGLLNLQSITDIAADLAQRDLIVKTIVDAGAVVVVIFVGYVVLRALIGFFNLIMRGDREDFQTILNTWKEQAKLQTDTNEIHRATNELLIKMTADYAAGRDAAVDRIIIRLNDLFDETKTIDVKLEDLKNMIIERCRGG